MIWTTPDRSPYFPVLAPRILHRHAAGGWAGVVERVVELARRADAAWAPPDHETFLATLRSLLVRGTMLPNSPLLVHAGDARPQIFACFALGFRRPLPDLLDLARRVHDGMGGVGYTLDGLPDAESTGAFIEALDRDTTANQPGRPRPASNSVTVDALSPAAPGILDAVGRVRCTNLNLGITGAFMDRLRRGDARATVIWRDLVRSIHRTGQPGVVFTDRIARIALDDDTAFAANVCGEAPLAIDESALLASLHLPQFAVPTGDGGWRLDDAALTTAARTTVRFLDGMHDIHFHPHGDLARNSLATRKIGVGVMGFSHLLARLGIRYGDPASLRIAGHVAKALAAATLAESEALGRARGSYPAWRPVHGPPRRNAALVAIAGTATLSLLANTTGGIEPIFAHLQRTRAMGRDVVLLDPMLAHLAEEAHLALDRVVERLLAGEGLSDIAGDGIAFLLPTAHQLRGDEHIRVQAAFQRHIDGGVSKTVNCAPDTEEIEIAEWLELAYDEGCLGLTIYRDGTVPGQPFTTATTENA